MRIFHYILFLSFVTGCKSDKIFCENELVLLKGNSENFVELDLGLNRKELINSIQSQTQLDLSTSPILSALMITSSREFEFSLVVIDDCDKDTRYPNTIRIVSNQNQQTVINNHMLSDEKQLIDIIEEISAKINRVSPLSEIVYLIEWDIGTDEDFIKSQIEKILTAIMRYANSLSLEKFNTSICNLDVSNLKYIDSEFHGIIGLAGMCYQKAKVQRNR